MPGVAEGIAIPGHRYNKGVIRGLLILIGSLIAFAFLRQIIAMVMGALTGAPDGEAPSGRRPPPGPIGPESLVKDPVCGTFVASSSRWVKEKGGETYHFCSAECRDKFAA